jgi:hypothetical protein
VSGSSCSRRAALLIWSSRYLAKRAAKMNMPALSQLLVKVR